MKRNKELKAAKKDLWSMKQNPQIKKKPTIEQLKKERGIK